MNISIASDHGAYALKERLKAHLLEQGHQVTDCGTNTTDSCDYPDFARPAAQLVADGKCDRGVVLCTTGIGVSMTANKVKGVRCALCHDPLSAEMTRRHNDANVLAMGAEIIGGNLAQRILDVFLSTEFEGGRHQRRVDKVMETEREGGSAAMDRDTLQERFDYWCKKLRLTPGWDVKLEWVDDPEWRKTGDFKIDCTDRKAILMLNAANPRQENLEEDIVHELMHLKLYPLDQVTEALITSHFEEGAPARSFAYRQFFTSLEITVEELAKCFLLEFGEDKELSFGRCREMKSFDELYEGLRPL